MKVTIDGIEIAAARRDPPEPTGQPLIATLHGGLYTGRYFDVPIPPTGSFVDLATRLGHPTVCFDRPGYGASGALAPEENTFERHAELLGAAITEVADGAPVILVGHSIGGMIALTIAAMSDGPALLGVSVTGMGAVIPSGGLSEQLATAAAGSGQPVIALPPEQCDPVMFGPPGTFDPGVLDAAHETYAPAPRGRAHRRLTLGRRQTPRAGPGGHDPDPQRPRRARLAVGHVGREHRAVRRPLHRGAVRRRERDARRRPQHRPPRSRTGAPPASARVRSRVHSARTAMTPAVRATRSPLCIGPDPNTCHDEPLRRKHAITCRISRIAIAR